MAVTEAQVVGLTNASLACIDAAREFQNKLGIEHDLHRLSKRSKVVLVDELPEMLAQLDAACEKWQGTRTPQIIRAIEHGQPATIEPYRVRSDFCSTSHEAAFTVCCDFGALAAAMVEVASGATDAQWRRMVAGWVSDADRLGFAARWLLAKVRHEANAAIHALPAEGGDGAAKDATAEFNKPLEEPSRTVPLKTIAGWLGWDARTVQRMGREGTIRLRKLAKGRWQIHLEDVPQAAYQDAANDNKAHQRAR